VTVTGEFGHIPLLVWPKVYESYRLVLREPVVLVRGVISRREGTLNLVVQHVQSLKSLGDAPKGKNWQ